MHCFRPGPFPIFALLLTLGPAFADDAGPSPLDRLDRKKIPTKLKPPRSAPAPTLVELGLRDGRWDTVAVRPDGRMIAASEPAGTLWLWSVPEFKVVGKLNHPQIVALAFSPDGKTLAAGDAKGNLRLWTVGTTGATARAQLASVHKDGPMWAVAFAPDSKLLATAGADGDIKLWDLKGPKPTLKATIEAHKEVVRQLAFSPDGERLASAGSNDRTAKLWDVTGEKPKEVAVMRCEGPVASVSFAPDGKALATASFDGKVRVWKVDGDTPEVELTLEMAKKSVRLVQFAPDGRTLAALVLDERGEHIAVRDREGNKLHDWEFAHHVQGLTFADARHLVTANEDSVYILRLAKE